MTKKIYTSLLLLQHLAIVACVGQIAITDITCICSSGTPGAISLIAQGTAGPFYTARRQVIGITFPALRHNFSRLRFAPCPKLDGAKYIIPGADRALMCLMIKTPPTSPSPANTRSA